MKQAICQFLNVKVELLFLDAEKILFVDKTIRNGGIMF